MYESIDVVTDLHSERLENNVIVEYPMECLVVHDMVLPVHIVHCPVSIQ